MSSEDKTALTPYQRLRPKVPHLRLVPKVEREDSSVKDIQVFVDDRFGGVRMASSYRVAIHGVKMCLEGWVSHCPISFFRLLDRLGCDIYRRYYR